MQLVYCPNRLVGDVPWAGPGMRKFYWITPFPVGSSLLFFLWPSALTPLVFQMFLSVIRTRDIGNIQCTPPLRFSRFCQHNRGGFYPTVREINSSRSQSLMFCRRTYWRGLWWNLVHWMAGIQAVTMPNIYKKERILALQIMWCPYKQWCNGGSNSTS